MARSQILQAPRREASDQLNELRRLNWALAAYARSASLLVHATDPREVMAKICEGIVSQSAYIVAAVGLAETGPGKPVRVVAAAGPAAAYVDGLELSWSETEPGGIGPTGIALRSGTARISRDSFTDPAFAPWRERGARFGVRSSVTVPFGRGGEVMGALLVYANQTDAFGPEELALFERLGEELAFAIAVEEDRGRLKEAETALIESEARYRSLFDYAPDGIIVISPEGTYIDINPGACEMLGYRREDFIGLSGPDLLDEDQLLYVDAAAAEIREKGIYRRAWRLRRKDGSVAPAEVVTTRMPDGVYISIIRDMTERERAEAARLAAEEALRETQMNLARAGRAAALGEVVATISHEVNQPLAAILTNSDAARRWLARTPPDLAAVETSLGAIQRDSQRASEVIKRTRRFLSGSQPDMAPFDLNTAIAEVVALSRSEQRRSEVIVRLDLAPGLPPVRADCIQIQQVTLNLILNALDAMAQVKNRPRQLTIATEAAGADTVTVSVRDNGHGLGAQAVNRVFDQFYTTKRHGTGVGLAISRSLIEAHGGRIWAEPTLDRGAIFRFTLPLEPLAAK